jgi:hypothetical protein
MTEEQKTTEQLLQEAMAKANENLMNVPEEAKPKTFAETYGLRPLNRGNTFFPKGFNLLPDLLPKMVDNKVVELHKPRTVIGRNGKPRIVGVPIMVAPVDLKDKSYHNGVLMTKAERDALSWEEIEASNKVVRNQSKAEQKEKKRKFK